MPRKPKAPKPPDLDVETFSLYSGEVEISFKKSSHRYKVSDLGSKPEQASSVTTILNCLAKPALIEWACRVCCDYVEENIRALIAGNSFSVEALLKVIADARSAHTRLKEEAAEIGTSAHDWLRDYWLAFMRDLPGPALPEAGPIRNCTTAALDWFSQHKVVPLYIEQPIYSRQHKITGRPDFIGLVDGEPSVIDYKSTKQIWPECPLQMAPYAKFHNEERPDPPIEVRWALRMDKLTGEFEDRRYPPESLPEDFETFMCINTIYSRMKHLRRKPKSENWLEELE